MVPGDPDHEEVSAARTHPSHLQLCHCFPNCLTSSSASSASVKTDQIKRLKDRRGKHVDCPCVFQLSAQSTDWCDQRYEIQRTPSVIENGCTVRPWIFPGAGENTCSFMFAPTFHQSTALWLETNVTHVNRIIFFKLKGRTGSHTFRPRWRCVRQPWPAGEDLPAESFLPEAQRRRSRVHGDQTFLDLHLKLFHSFLPLWCHLWIPSFVSICFCLVFVVTTKTLWCFTIRLPVLVQGFRDSAGGAFHDKLTGRVWHWGFQSARARHAAYILAPKQPRDGTLNRLNCTNLFLVRLWLFLKQIRRRLLLFVLRLRQEFHFPHVWAGY